MRYLMRKQSFSWLVSSTWFRISYKDIIYNISDFRKFAEIANLCDDSAYNLMRYMLITANKYAIVNDILLKPVMLYLAIIALGAGLVTLISAQIWKLQNIYEA